MTQDASRRKEALMRLALAIAALAIALPALAQQRPQARPPQPPAAQQAPEPPPGMFPCRTENEICFIGVVTGANQVAILFTNAPPAVVEPPPQPAQGRRGAAPRTAAPPPAEDIGEKPVDVLTGEAPGAPLDLAPHLGRVVMLTGAFDPKTGLTKAELVEVAGPLLSFALKSTLTGGDDQPASPPARGGRPQGRR
jgi:hypothetical protein